MQHPRQGTDLFAESAHADLYAAVDELVDKMDRQVVRHKDRLPGPPFRCTSPDGRVIHAVRPAGRQPAAFSDRPLRGRFFTCRKPPGPFSANCERLFQAVHNRPQKLP